MNSALLLIDLQNDYFPGGKNALVESEAAAVQARRLLDAFRQRGRPVIHVQHFATRPGASFFVPGTRGVEIYPLLQPQPGEAVIHKNHPNCFRQTDLLDHLRSLEVERLAVCGMMTHMCLDAGVRAAVDLGYECWVAADACATKDLSFGGVPVPAAQVQAAFLAALAAAYAHVVPADELLESIFKE
jgi:nicotinamidase-related amidase